MKAQNFADSWRMKLILCRNKRHFKGLRKFGKLFRFFSSFFFFFKEKKGCKEKTFKEKNMKASMLHKKRFAQFH